MLKVVVCILASTTTLVTAKFRKEITAIPVVVGKMAN